MPEYSLTDEQWLILDLLMRARKKHIDRLNRLEILHSRSLPQGAAVKLAWAALMMPPDIVAWPTQHEFSITDAGVSLYNLRFDNPEPSAIGDAVICLPGPSDQRS